MATLASVKYGSILTEKMLISNSRRRRSLEAEINKREGNEKEEIKQGCNFPTNFLLFKFSLKVKRVGKIFNSAKSSQEAD